MPIAEFITTEQAADTIVLRPPEPQPAAEPDARGAPTHARRRVRLFETEIDVLRMPEAVERLRDWVTRRDDFCRYVVTPNVDHAVLLAEHKGLRRAYAEASLVLADGAPLVWVSRWLGKPLPERVAGSDLVPALFETTPPTLRVFLLGGAPGVAERAAANIAARWPAVTVTGTASPPKGFEHDELQNAAVLARIQKAKPDIVLVGLGAPKQELWVWRHQRAIAAPVALCIGATIDFLAGERSRAPRWMRSAGLEWLYRVGTEPRRLGARYARDAWIFPRLVWWELRRPVQSPA
jgi:N-acetylglucosaminyldiphosphoundecaprenol N-acetyl-beta-D-mannosaminyltransferase